MKQAGSTTAHGAADRARDTLLDAVRACRESGAERLPTVRRLAAMAGVCHVTMQKAVRELANAGILHTRRGSGLFAGAERTLSDSVAPQANDTASAQTVRRLERDIASGKYRPGQVLPLQKQLCVTYGVGRDTARKALEQLVARSVIRPDGGRYRVLPTNRRPAVSGTVLVFGAGFRRGTIQPDTRHMDSVMALENACIRANLSISNVYYRYTGTELKSQGPAKAPPYSPRDLESVLGFVVFTRGLQGLGLERFVRLMLGYGKPVAVLDENGLYAAGRALPRRKNLRIFPIGYSAAPAEAMGRLLLRLGHRRVAYLDPYPQDLWSRNRLAGLRQAWRAAGYADGVVHVPVATPPPAPLYDESGRYMGDVAALMADGLDQRDSVQARLARIVREDRSSALSVHLMRWHGADSLTRALAPAIEGLLPRTEITAWAAANDEVAMAVIRGLEARGLRVPHDRSVVGFDDGYDAHLFDLTTVSFNSTAAVQAMVDFIVNPGWRPLSHGARECVVEVNGYVKERGTSGPAHRGRTRLLG
ncbi:MAG: GntR family transcriptional regulator [Chitinivibrionales bacterium]|nr:GntR family transcriptional regulator [Chitinivibrionales bacterium]